VMDDICWHPRGLTAGGTRFPTRRRFPGAPRTHPVAEARVNTNDEAWRSSSPSGDPVRIDGSYGEGGGQILRTSVSLAAVTGKTFEIVNIRARRSRPGLQPQHLMAVRAAGRICAARLEGDAVGSSRLLFEPHAPPTAGTYCFDIRTAGAAP